MAYILGIDQGTTQTTAIVLDDAGRVAGRASYPVATRYPRPGWVEQNPQEILRAVRAAAVDAMGTLPIAAVGLDNQGETFLLWDADSGEPVTPAIVWQDKRGQSVCDRLAHEVDAAWLQRTTGLVLDTYFSAPKLSYMLESTPSLRAAARAGRLRFGTIDTWLIWQLSGGRLHVTDASTASRTLLFDINKLAWNDDLLALFDVPPSLLPAVLPSAGLVGELEIDAGRRLPLWAMLVDQQAALFGQACFQQGDAKCTFGTGSFVLMNTGATPRHSRHGLLATVAWQLPGGAAYALDGGIFVTGAAVQWLAETLRLLPDVAASAAMAASSAGGVTFVPALAGLAAPHWQPDVRGAMFGLTRATTPEDIARATLEGIACRVHDVVRAMERDADVRIPRLKVDGGATANAYLMQCVADTLGVDVEVAASSEATAIGAASLAGHAALGIGLNELAARWRAATVYHSCITPDERAERLDRWQRALAALRTFHSPARAA